MTDEEIIEKRIQSRGGRLNYDVFPKNMVSDFEYLKKRAEDTIKLVVTQFPKIKEIKFDFINSYSFNAFATGINQKYFIGINRGTLATIILIYDRFLADKEIFKFIGNPDAEVDELPTITKITGNYSSTVKGLPFFSPPKDPDRNIFARRLAILTLDFILAHEITHVVNGHVDFFINELKLDIDELTLYNKKGKIFPLINKTLEMDADSGASKMLLSSEIGKVLGVFPKPPNKEFYKKPGMVLLQYSFVFSTLFRTFGDQRLDDELFVQDTYPKPRLRFVIAMLKISELQAFKDLQKVMNFDLDKNGIPITIGLGFQTIEEAFNRVMDKEALNESIEDAWGKKGENQINKLVEFWNEELLEKLQKYSYTKLEKYKKRKLHGIE